MRRDPTDLLQDILDFIDRIESWTLPETSSGKAMDEKTLYAVLHALQCIGEASARLPTNVMDLAPEVPWAKIRGMRNIIVHDYGGIDTDIVWKTVTQRYPSCEQPSG